MSTIPLRLATWDIRDILLVYDPTIIEHPRASDKMLVTNVPVYGPIGIVGLHILDRSNEDVSKWDCEFIYDRAEMKPDAWALVLIINGAVMAYGWSYQKVRKCAEECLRSARAECFWYVPPFNNPDYAGKRRAEEGIRITLLEMVEKGYII